jgi:hypothetical protein
MRGALTAMSAAWAPPGNAAIAKPAELASRKPFFFILIPLNVANFL